MILIVKGFETRKGLIEGITFSGQGAHLADPCVGFFFIALDEAYFFSS